jgi:hypothetical protein
MSFKINVSNAGPIITYNNAIYTLQDMTDLFDLVEEHPEFVGVMPIRQDIEVLPADEPKRLLLGWVVNELIGIGVVNPRGCGVGRKSVSVG